MRYCTKEIYETMHKTGFHLLLDNVSKKAEVFDEKYYRALYAKKLDEELAIHKRASELSFDDFLAKFGFEDKAAFENSRLRFEPEVFDEKKIKSEFAAEHRNMVRLLQESLPGDITGKVADIRVLALGTASAEVKRLITAFCKNNEREVNRAFKELHKAENREFGDDLPGFCQESLHDCEVLSCRMKGKDLVLELDNSGGFTAASEVKFKNAEIIEREGRLTGAVWLYDEVYKCERGLEIHALLSYRFRRGGLRYLTVQCEDTEFVFDDSEEE